MFLERQLLADLTLGFLAGALLRWGGLRVFAGLVIPPVVSYFAFGPKHFSGSVAGDGSGLIYTFYIQFVLLGLPASVLGVFLGGSARRFLTARRRPRAAEKNPEHAE